MTTTPYCRTCAFSKHGLCSLLALAEAAPPMRSRAHKARSVIQTRGDRAEHVAILCEGMAIEYLQLVNGRRQIVSLVTPGATLYWAHGKAAETSLLALTDVRVVLVPLSHVARSVAQNPALLASIVESLEIRRLEVCELAADIGRRNAFERICRLLLKMLRISKAPISDNQALLRMPLKRDEVADLLGLTTTHVTRVFTSLRAQELVSVRGDVYTLRDVARLVDAGG